ncbi:MAG: glycosyltransferase family 2 protein [Candidatus Micrarchaeota archaeon]
MKISVIMPAYNEEKHIATVIEGVKALYDYELIVVDDGSSDNTAEEAKKAGAIVISHPYNKGYGAALKTGTRNANGDVVVYIDSDGQHDPKYIADLVKHIDKYDMVVGARQWDKSRVMWYRRPAKWFLRKLASFLSGKHIPDLNSGYRAIRKDIVDEFMYLLPNGFSLTTTITIAAFKAGYDVRYVPIVTTSEKEKSKIRPFRDGSRFIMLIIRTIMLFDPLKIFLPASLLVFLAGASIFAYEYITSLNVGEFSALLISTSILIFFFGLLAEQTSFMRREPRER